MPEQDPDLEPVEEGKPSLSYGKAMAAYAIIAVLSLITLHGDLLYLTLLIIAALALKTWLARVRGRLE
jgi:hypothetical protein